MRKSWGSVSQVTPLFVSKLPQVGRFITIESQVESKESRDGMFCNSNRLFRSFLVLLDVASLRRLGSRGDHVG